MDSIDLAKTISELGALVVICAIAITGGVMMFRSVLRNNDRLAPAIDNMARAQDRLSTRLDKQDRNDALLQAQAESVAQQVQALHEALDCHDATGIETNKKTFELLEHVAEQLNECISTRRGDR